MMEKIDKSSPIEFQKASPAGINREKTQYQELFLETIYQLHKSSEREKILQTAVTLSRRALAADRVLVYSLESHYSGQVIAESVATGWPPALGKSLKDPCFSAHYWEKYQNGRVSAINDIHQAKLTPCHLGQLEPLAVKANLVVPIWHRGSLLGLLIAHQCSTPRSWQPAEIDLLIQLSRHLGLALEKAQLLRDYKQSQKPAQIPPQWLKSSANLLKLMQNCTTEEDIFKIVVNFTRLTMDADRVLVYSLEDHSSGRVIAESVESEWPQALGKLIKDPCFGAYYWEKYQDGRVSAINDIYQAKLTPCHLGQLEPLAVKANLVAPIVNRVSLLGLLIAHQCSQPRSWQPEEISWFQQVAMQTGLAINEQRLLKLLNKSG